MKKLFISLLMAIGLCGLAMAQTTSLTATGSGYFSFSATVTLSADDKTAVENADTLMFVTNPATSAITNLANLPSPFGPGETLQRGFFQPYTKHHVVYTAKPDLNESNTATLNLTTPASGIDAYLQLYTGKKTTTGSNTTWTYTLLTTSAAKFQTEASKIELGNVANYGLKAKIYLDDTLMKQVKSASTLLALTTQSNYNALNVKHNKTTRYAVGDYTANDYKVVYHNTPTFTDDWCEIDVTGLEIGESGYIVLCTGKEDNGAWNYSQGFLLSKEYEVAPLNITATEVEYSTLKASVTLDETAKTTYNASAALVAVAAPFPTVPVLNTYNQARPLYEVGEELNGNPIVFVGKPALTADDKLEFTCPNLTPGATVYLNFFLCTETEGGYTNGTFYFAHAQEAAEMKAIAAPTKLTAGPVQDGKLPLTIEADANFTTMIVKSPSIKSIQPQGNLKVNDIWENYSKILNAGNEIWTVDKELVNTGKVVAFLEPGVTTYDLPMEAGEACYVHAYAVANAETDAAAYATDMVMAPVYRMAEKLPLSYTFSANDYIEFDYTSMPLLPPGLSTTANPTEAELKEYVSSAFHTDILDGEEVSYLLWSNYPSSDDMGDDWGGILAASDEAGGEETTELRWIDWVTPEFTGVSLVQARFKTMLLEQGNGRGSASRKVADGDEVRMEYNINGGEWQAIQTFAATDFPAQEGTSYNLTVDFKCKPTDVVRIRYSYRSTVTGCMLAVAGYEIVEGRSCATPANLKSVAESITGSAIALSWQDQNVDEPASYMVYYENAAEPTANGLVSATAMTATVDELLPSTTYNVRVQAVCGRGDSSFFSAPIAIATAKGIPYSESMAAEIDFDFFSGKTTILSKPDVTVYAQASLETPKAEWAEVKEYVNTDQEIAMATGSWDAYWCTNGMYGQGIYSMGIHSAVDMALMTTPVIYVPEAETPLNKTLTFKANPYKMGEDDLGYYPINNADLPADIRLYVLASTDGFATWDTVATYDHTALYDENAAEDPDAGIGGYNDGASLPDMSVGDGEEDEDPNPGKLLSINLNKYQGALQLGFYFRSPEQSMDEELGMPYFLEICSVKLDYDQRVQPYDLAVEPDEYSAVIKWKGEGEVYRIYYGLASDETYTDSVNVVAAPGTMMQFDTIKNLKDNTTYKVGIVSYSNGFTKASAMGTTTFTTLEHLYKVTAIVTPEDGGTVTGAGEYFIGRTANLTATANSGYRFAAWKAGETTLSAEPTLSIKVAGDTTVTAVFETIPTYTLTLTASPAEGGKVEGAGSVEANASVTVKATANEGYKFVAWKNGETELSKDASYTFQMPAQDVTYTAVFETIPTHTLTLTASPAEGGKVEGADKYHEGDTVTVKATANEGYRFVAWINGTDTLSTQASYTFQMPAQDVTYTAVFAKGTANEALLQASFTVGTQDGRLYVRNLNGITVKDINVYGLTGSLINRFAPNSREDLSLPIDAQRAILFVRLNTEKGVAVYKVYLQ